MSEQITYDSPNPGGDDELEVFSRVRVSVDYFPKTGLFQLDMVKKSVDEYKGREGTVIICSNITRGDLKRLTLLLAAQVSRNADHEDLENRDFYQVISRTIEI